MNEINGASTPAGQLGNRDGINLPGRLGNDGYGPVKPGAEQSFGRRWRGYFHFTPEEPGNDEYRFESRLWHVADINPSDNSVVGTIEVIEPPPDFQPPEMVQPEHYL